MKIVSNKKYQAFWDVIIKQQKMIDDRDKKIKELEDRISFLRYYSNFKKHFSSMDCHGQINIDFPNSETEIWNGPTGQIIQPKGTFEKIFNDPDEDQEDRLF